ncbi:hypothetical protein PRIPAC_71653 [Pristionchus pacificus]|nr:hypothetical protein PRIPAC_71653 [Pristionchus pacificus]
MRLSLSILFLLTGFTTPAPFATEDPEVAAKQFFGALATHFRSGDNEKLFDTLHSKWEHFYPLLVAPDIMKDLRAAFLVLRESQAKNHTEVPVVHLLSTARAVDKIEKEIKRRIWWLNAEGREFVKKAFASFPHKLDGATKLGPLSKKFSAFRAEFDALAPSTKKKMAKRFEIFAHLDEVKSLVSTYDSLLSATQIACENLIGFSGCDHIEKMDEATEIPEIPEMPETTVLID